MTAGVHFIDTNMLVRHLTQDHAQQSPACTALLTLAERNDIQLTTSESVVTEVVQVLSSPRLYNFPRVQVSRLLTALLSLPGMRCAQRPVYLHALALYAQEAIDFPDCLTAAHMHQERIGTLYSYDRDFDRFAWVERREPDGMDAS